PARGNAVRPGPSRHKARVQPETSFMTTRLQRKRADVLQGGVTALSVAGTLLGLSLTLTTRLHRHLVWPSAVITAATIAGAGYVAVPVHITPEGAIESLAEGDNRSAKHQYTEAISAYTRAIEADPQYAVAYEHRAIAQAVQASPQRDSMVMYFSASTPTALRASIRDMEKARALGSESLSTLVHLGYANESIGRFTEAEPPLRRAITLFPSLPLPWMDLALSLLGQGRQQEAERALDEGIRKLVARPSAVERRELFATMRSAFFEFADRYPGRRQGAETLISRLVREEGRQMMPDAAGSSRGGVTDFALSQKTYALQIKLRYANFAPRTRVAWLVYYRAAPDDDWVQRPDMIRYEMAVKAEGKAVLPVNDTACPTAGEYRAEFYLDGRKVAETRLERTGPPVALGADVVMTRRNDPIGGLSYCAPSSWAVSAPYSGAADLSSADSRTRISLRALPLTQPPATPAARVRLTKKVADRLAEQFAGGRVTERIPVDPDDRTQIVRRFRLTGDLVAGVTVQVGTDNVLRTMTVVGPDGDRSVLTEISESVAIGNVA
ncbi:MAG: hypothetical protein QG622_2375, partial [Actinomycetota bacterium]|nr:hypothetical protein [Actinomycetota bacterium]